MARVKRAEVSEEALFADVQKSAESTIATIKSLNVELNEAAKVLSKDLSAALVKDTATLAKFNKAIAEANKLKQTATILDKQQIKAEEQKTKAAINAERIAREKLKTQREEVRNSEQLKKQKDAQAKAEERAAKAAIDEANAYKILSNRTRDQKNESKRLAAEMIHLAETGRRNSKEYRQLASTYRQVTREAQKGDVALKKIDATVGDNFRNVGAYKTGLQGLTRGLMQLAGGFSLMQGIRGSIGVLKEFDEKLADIQKTTGLSKQGAKDVSMSLLKIDTKSSVTELQELASAAGRLGFTAQKDIVSFATAADKVFVALGDDLDGTAEEIATSLGKMASVFGLEQEFGIGVAIEKVGSGMNELSASSKASAPAILDFTQRMAGMASVLEIEDVQALGAFFDEAGQSIEVSASTLSKLLPDLSADYKRFAEVANMTPEAFKKIAEESPIEALKAVAVGAKSNEKGLFALTETLESYGVEGARAAGIVGVLTNNTERLTELQEINREAIAKNTSITDEFNTKNETLGATWDKLVKRVQTWVIKGDSAIGITNGLKNAMAFLGDNFDEVVSGIGKLIKIYVTYKLITNDNVKATASFIMNLGKMEGVSTKAGDSLKKIGGALKGIGWAAAINYAIEFAMELYDVASGAQFARFELEKLEEMRAKGSEKGQAASSAVQKSLEAELFLINEAVSLGRMSEADAAKQRKNAIARHRGAVSDKIKELRLKLEELRLNRDLAKSELEKYQSSLIGGVPFTQAQGEQLTKLRNAYLVTNGSVEAYKSTIRELRVVYGELNGQVQDATISENEQSKSVAVSTGALKAQNKELEKKYKLITDIDAILNEGQTLEEIEDEEINLLNEKVERELTKRLTMINDAERLGTLSVEEAAEQRIIAELDGLIEKKRILELYGRDTVDIEKEISEKRLELSKSGIEATAEATEDALEREKEAAQFRMDLAKMVADYLIQQSDRRIEALDKEIDAHQKQFDYLAELAAQGNINAKESLAEQQRLINEANKAKLEEEKRKQRIELAATAYSAYQKNVDSGSANPLADTIRDISLLQAFINSLPAFEDGIENTGQNGQGVDGKGGFLSVLHPYERVVPKEENAKIGNLSNDELARIAHDYQTGKLVSFGESAISFGGWDTSALLNKLDAVEKAIKSQPVVDWDIHGITTEVLSLVRKEKNGNTTTYNRYRVD